MNFNKVLGVKRGGRNKGYSKGYVTIKDGKLHFVMYGGNKRIKEVGFIDDGLGCVTEDIDRKNKFDYCQAYRAFEEEDIPINLQAEGYTFKILAEEVSENEYVFMFKNAFML